MSVLLLMGKWTCKATSMQFNLEYPLSLLVPSWLLPSCQPSLVQRVSWDTCVWKKLSLATRIWICNFSMEDLVLQNIYLNIKKTYPWSLDSHERSAVYHLYQDAVLTTFRFRPLARSVKRIILKAKRGSRTALFTVRTLAMHDIWCYQ